MEVKSNWKLYSKDTRVIGFSGNVSEGYEWESGRCSEVQVEEFDLSIH